MRPTNRAALLTWRGVMGVDVTGPVTSRLGFSVGGLVCWEPTLTRGG